MNCLLHQQSSTYTPPTSERSENAASATDGNDVSRRLHQLEARLSAIEAQAAPTMDTEGAMKRLQYTSVNGFWQAVRRLGIPYSHLSARQCVFRTSDIDAALLRRQVGTTRPRRTAA